MAQERTKSEYEQLRSGAARSTAIEVLSPHIEIKYEIGRAWVTLLTHDGGLNHAVVLFPL